MPRENGHTEDHGPREDTPKMKTPTPSAPELQHAAGCPTTRQLDITEHVGEGLRVVCCLDCGRRQVTDRAGSIRPEPTANEVGPMRDYGRDDWLVEMRPAPAEPPWLSGGGAA